MIEDQPEPMPNALQPVWDAAIEDMRQRDAVGRERYGTPLQPFNGRDPLIDAYQEMLDACVYLKQAIMERDLRQMKKNLSPHELIRRLREAGGDGWDLIEDPQKIVAE
jgi:hypothetical protein